jgi:hypothetical protein
MPTAGKITTITTVAAVVSTITTVPVATTITTTVLATDVITTMEVCAEMVTTTVQETITISPAVITTTEITTAAFNVRPVNGGPWIITAEATATQDLLIPVPLHPAPCGSAQHGITMVVGTVAESVRLKPGNPGFSSPAAMTMATAADLRTEGKTLYVHNPAIHSPNQGLLCHNGVLSQEAEVKAGVVEIVVAVEATLPGLQEVVAKEVEVVNTAAAVPAAMAEEDKVGTMLVFIEG